MRDAASGVSYGVFCDNNAEAVSTSAANTTTILDVIEFMRLKTAIWRLLRRGKGSFTAGTALADARGYAGDLDSLRSHCHSFKMIKDAT